MFTNLSPCILENAVPCLLMLSDPTTEWFLFHIMVTMEVHHIVVLQWLEATEAPFQHLRVILHYIKSMTDYKNLCQIPLKCIVYHLVYLELLQTNPDIDMHANIVG
ncbi:unnamed protein product, partial [Meganyctiphanes norvegica]